MLKVYQGLWRFFFLSTGLKIQAITPVALVLPTLSLTDLEKALNLSVFPFITYKIRQYYISNPVCLMEDIKQMN